MYVYSKIKENFKPYEGKKRFVAMMKINELNKDEMFNLNFFRKFNSIKFIHFFKENSPQTVFYKT